jgi:hypothetical protein
MTVWRSINGEPYKSEKILTIFDNEVEPIGVFLSRREAAYALRKFRLAKKNA